MKIGGCIPSKPSKVLSGVPAGSILAPILFQMFINDLPSSLKTSSYHIFADDFQLYSSASLTNLNSLIATINSDLERVEVWASKNKMVLNPVKSVAMVISNKRLDINSIPPIKLNNTKIDFKQETKSLGLVLDSKLDWGAHIRHICAKVYNSLSKLAPHSKFTPIGVRLRLFKALILPHFNYCGQIFAGACEENKSAWNDLNVASCARYVFNKKVGEHITHFSNKLVDCSLIAHFKFLVANQIYRVVTSTKPIYLFEKLQPSFSKRTCNLNLPSRCRTRTRRSSFAVYGTKVWNSLNDQTKSSLNPRSFGISCRKQLSDH